MRLGMLSVLVGCGGDPLYAPCDGPADCPAPEGVESECLAKSGDGFCTWECTVDEDCVFDEDDWGRVCASFESEEGTHCFPSCREAEGDDGAVCPDDFTCRSTGGGSDNRKVCFPDALDVTEPATNPG
jgi:hypothetical protein